jgi:hypothetical protein
MIRESGGGFVLLWEVTRASLSRSSEPPAFVSDHLTILDVSDPSSTHRLALDAAFATLQAIALEASHPLCPLPHLTRVLRCERAATRARRRPATTTTESKRRRRRRVMMGASERRRRRRRTRARVQRKRSRRRRTTATVQDDDAF